MNIFRIFQKNFKKLLLLALMLVLPIYVIQEFLIIPSLPDDLETGDLRMIWYTLSIWLISLFLYVFRISVIKLSYDSLEEKDTGISELMDFSVRLWPKVLLTTLLYALSVACGLMLFFFPGLILFVAYAFYQYISVKTGLWGRKALFLSSLYTKKNLGKAAAIAFGSVMLRYALSYGASALEGRIANALLRPAIAVVLFVLLELVACLIDIFAANYIFNTKIDFDITVLQKKKSADDAER